MKKVLFVATVVKTHIMEFHLPYLKMFQQKGWHTAVAAKNDYEDPNDCVIPYCDAYYDIAFERSPLKLGNLRAYWQLKKIIDEGGYDIIHCHTPVGAMLARIAARKARKQGSRIIYTAHGFHFFKGAPLLNWLVYFPAEWLCSFMTDTLITINREDYAFAKKHMHAQSIEYVPGVGIDLNKFSVGHIDKNKIREDLEVPVEKIWFLTVGELIRRKNHETLIRAAANFPNIYLTIAGRGELTEQVAGLIRKLHLEERVKLLGYRTDIARLCTAADIFAFPSFQEGLSVALMEAMACGKPIVCGAIRGNIDLIDEMGGELFNPHSTDELKRAIEKILAADRLKMGAHNADKVKSFGIDKVMEEMKKIYFN